MVTIAVIRAEVVVATSLFVMLSDHTGRLHHLLLLVVPTTLATAGLSLLIRWLAVPLLIRLLIRRLAILPWLLATADKAIDNNPNHDASKSGIAHIIRIMATLLLLVLAGWWWVLLRLGRSGKSKQQQKRRNERTHSSLLWVFTCLYITPNPPICQYIHRETPSPDAMMFVNARHF